MKNVKTINILIDNGHGVETKGKRSPDGKLLEGVYTREIASLVKKKLKDEGYNVILVTPEQKDVPLKKRCDRVNAYCDEFGKDNCLLVSIHVNAAGDGSFWMNGKGFEVWTTYGETMSDKLAECFYCDAAKTLRGFNLRRDKTDGDSDKESNFYILYHTKCPAILTENLFMDNKKEAEYLLTKLGKQSIVDLHVNAIKDFLNKL